MKIDISTFAKDKQEPSLSWAEDIYIWNTSPSSLSKNEASV